jgi:hypothetical protein
VARGARHGLWVAAAFSVFLSVGNIVVTGHVGFDAHAYYAAWDHRHLYGAAPESDDAYLYSPAFAELIWPLTLVPWVAFCALWLGAMTAVYLWLLAPLPMRWRLPLLVLALSLDSAGNVWAVFALVLVFGFRRPAAWAFPALTKVTPFVGPIWFASRREWRKASTALGVAAAIIAFSAIADPQLWHEWVHFLLSTRPNQTGAPMLTLPTPALLGLELPIAVALTIYGARTNRAWLVPVAMVFADPVFSVNGFLVLAAIPRIRQGFAPEPSGFGTVRPMNAPRLAASS